MEESAMTPDNTEEGAIEESEEHPRSVDEQNGDAQPVPSEICGPDPEADPDLNKLMFAPASNYSVTVLNRGLLGVAEEGVPGCTVDIGPTSATTNQSGNANLDLSSIPDGTYALKVTPPAGQMENGPVGPGLPADPSKDRVWSEFLGTVQIAASKIVDADPSEWIDHSKSQRLRIALMPKWMRSEKFGTRSRPVDMIIIHHVGLGNTASNVYRFVYDKVEVSIHYLIAPNGDTYKFVDESERAWHAGYPGEECYWLGDFDLNQNSVGIEMVHHTGSEYNTAQVDALVGLVERLLAGYKQLPKVRVVGHSDVGLREVEKRPPIWLGRKSTDPGSAFPWEQLEAKGIGLIAQPGHVDPAMYGSYFTQEPTGKLKSGDRDDLHRYGGKIIPQVSGAVEELQRDLDAIGYYCKPFDGKFGEITRRALQMFEEHIYSGSRRRGPDPWNSGDGKLDRRDADLIKRVMGKVT
ncbi:MAG: hypothetical protein E5Y65_16425 [Mesorhizobium sp.]|jgi:N-acetylmuramoyl-L-alanine amidase|nr:MAG: hypothetical protein E5Y70_07235 [Mesorhizobium sp.]TIL89514.1 MAG: hypothetical protein E5Y65_16425 [Mesorhizobium sp.]TIM00536.1 MAG: hypothetical protein E5Y64_16265 [Mesorhizobium sp.]